MSNQIEPQRRRQPPVLDLVKTDAVLVLQKALVDKRKARRELDRPELSPIARANAIGVHDRAAKRITDAKRELDEALLADEDA